MTGMRAVFLGLVFAVCGIAQYPLTVTPYQVVYTSNGAAIPCVNCALYTYSAGTTTPLATYPSFTVTGTALPNPVRTNSAGYMVNGSNVTTGVWVPATSCYHLVLKTAAAVTVWDQDHVCNPAQVGTNVLALLAASSGSSLVGFIQSGTGAVAETVQAKLRQTISVMDFGAKCDGSTDDTTAIQAALNAASSNSKVIFPQLCVATNLYVASTKGGITLEGTGLAVLGGGNNPTSGLKAKTGATGALLSIYSENSTIRDLLIDCNSQCANPLKLVEAQSSVIDNVLAKGGTGSGIVLWNEGGPSTTTTSAITGGSTTVFTVANAALPGYPLSGSGNVGGNHCGALTISDGTNTESKNFGISSNTVTLTGAFTHSYASGSTVVCHGNDNSISMFAPSSKSNGGAGIDFVAGSDINSIGIFNPNMFGNTGCGILGSGSTNIVSGGTFEGNACVIQLGDATTRSTVAWEITAGDVESTIGSVVSTCDLWSTVHLRADIQGLIYDSNPCPTGGHQSTFGVGYALLQSGNVSEYVIKSISGVSYLQPGIAGWKTFNSVGVATFTNSSAVIAATNTFGANQPVIFYSNGALPSGFDINHIYFVSATGLSGSQFEVATTAGGTPIVAGSAGSGTQRVGTLVASPLYNSTGSTTGITTANIPPNRVFEDAGSANNALAVTLTDAVTGVAIPLNATNQGLTITIMLSHSLAAGAGNTLSVNGASALSIVSHFDHSSGLTAAYTAASVIVLIFDNSSGSWLDASQ